MTATGWREFALCAQTDPELFFPEKGASSTHARRICAECPVRLACLEYALVTNQGVGIWGNTSPKQRTVLRRAVAQ